MRTKHLMRFGRAGAAALLGLCLASALAGCGPGLLILGGGGAGGWLGLGSGGGGDDKKQPATPGPVGPTNTAPVAVVQALAREDSPAQLDFRLIDAEADLVDVVIEYALVADPQEADFSPCTGAIGSNITGLASSAGGTNHNFEWDYAADLGGLASTEGITIRVRPNDGTVDGSPGLLADLVVGNNAPVVMAAQAVGATLSGNVLITYDLADTTSDMAGFDVRIISSQQPEPIELTGSDFLGANPIGLPGMLNTSPAGTTGQIVWDSKKVFPFHEGTIQILITPKDQPAGFAQIAQGNALTIGPYTLNNIGNRAPTLQLVAPPDGQSFYGDVALRVLVQDLDSNSVYVHCQYQTDSGGAYTDCNMGGVVGAVGPFATLANQPLGYDLRWKALLDLQPQGVLLFDQCRLRLTVMDASAGSTLETGQFEVVLGEAPAITGAQVQGDDGQIPIVIHVLDRASDPVSLQIGYNFDNGPAFTPLAQQHFAYGNLSNVISGPTGSGYANVLVWNTLHSELAADFGVSAGNKPTVYLQIIATDHPPDDDTGDALDLELDSVYILGPFPVLNDPTDSDVVSVTITVTGGGDALTIAPTESRDLLATALPAQPSPYDLVDWFFYPAWILTVSEPNPSLTNTITLNADAEGFQFIEIWAYSVQNGVQGYYRLYIGDPVSSINALPDAEVTLVEGQGWVQFTATVLPLTAPQNQSWSVPEGMGYIQEWDGWYLVPNDVASTLLFNITVQSISPAISDTIPVRVVPRPDSILITGPGTKQVGSTPALYTAVITPAEAPQQVFWEIEWNGFNYGQGNDFFGRIDSAGNYTPPVVLPQPDDVYIVARSQVATYLYTAKEVQLTGNSPTNFTITMEPPSPSFVYANGQGKDFNAVNFTPPDAPYVTWSVDQPSLGFIDPISGYFTPAEDIGLLPLNVTIRATAVYGGVQKTFNLQIQPKQLLAPPSSITIQPSPALMPEDSYNNLDFLQLVNPLGAEQDVNWNIQVGLPTPAYSGFVDGQGRYYPPANYGSYTQDGTVVVRAQSTVAPSVTQNVNVHLSGYGQWQVHDQPSMGRNDAVGIWDPATQRCWFFGGRSETNRLGEMAMRPWVYDGNNTPAARWVAGPTLNDVIPGYVYKNAIAVQRVPSFAGILQPHLVAIVGDGQFEVDIAVLNLMAPTAWVSHPLGYDFGAGADFSDIPRITGVGRYHLMEDATGQELLLASSTTLYRLSYQTGLWLPRHQAVVNQPAAPNNLAYVFSGGNHRLLGPASTGAVETTLLELQLTPTPQWNTVMQTTAVVGPRSPPLSDSALVVLPSNGKILSYGGKRGATHVDEVWELDPLLATWTLKNTVTLKPFARSDSAFVHVTEAGAGKLLLYAGRTGALGLGICGDLWEYNETTGSFLAFNPSGIFPQARKYAGATWAGSSAGYLFGGICQHGISNETWRFTYNPATPYGFTWTRFAYTASATPPGLYAQNLVYDSTNGRVLMLWGSTAGPGQTSNAVAILNIASNTWTQMNPISGTPPLSRMGAAVCFDPDQQRVMSFGGLRQTAGANVLLNDIVYLKVTPVGSPAWQVPPSQSGTPPPPVVGAFAGYDTPLYFAGSSRFLIFGGNRNPNGELANSEIFTYNTAANQWGSIILARPYFSRPAYDCAAAFDSSNWRRFIYAPKGNNHAVAPVLGNAPEWQSMAGGTFDFNCRGAMGVYDPNSRRFFTLMGELDVPGIGPTLVSAFRVLKLGP